MLTGPFGPGLEEELCKRERSNGKGKKRGEFITRVINFYVDLSLRNCEKIIVIIGRDVILAEVILETAYKPDRGLVRLGKNSWGEFKMILGFD